MRNLLLMVLISFGNVYSQTKLYIRPALTVKGYVSSADNTLSNFLIFNNKTAKNPYFQVSNQLISSRSICYVGLNLGVNFKNNHSIEIGWSQDGTGSSWRDRMMTWDTTSFGLQTFSNNHTISKSHIHYQRLFIEYQFIFKDYEEKTNLGLTLSSGFLFNPNKKKNTLPPSIIYGSYSSPESQTNLDENISLTFKENEAFAFSRYSFFLALGFFSDVLVKKKYLFSFSLSYLQSFNYMEYSVHRYMINDNNIEKRLDYTSASRGSGFYLQISRKFQLYPWTKNKKSS